MPEPAPMPDPAPAHDPAAATDWTCERCGVTVSFMAGAADPGMPSSWVDRDGVLHCLGCRREMAGEAGTAELPEDAPAADRQKRHSHARIEFEIARDPERPDQQIAKACHTSVVAVRKARERLGIPRPH